MDNQSKTTINEDITIPDSVLRRIRIIDDIPENEGEQSTETGVVNKEPIAISVKKDIDETQKEIQPVENTSSAVVDETSKESQPLENKSVAADDTNVNIEQEQVLSASSFSREEVLLLRKKAEEIINGLQPVLNPNLDTQSIANDIKYLQRKQCDQVLKNTSIKELNSRRAGIRLSALQNYGINDLYGVLQYDYYELLRIPGIGQKSAEMIIRESSYLCNDALSHIKVRPNPDTTYGDERRLLKNIYVYLELEKLSKTVQENCFAIYRELNNLLQQTNDANSAAKWKLSTKKKKVELLKSAEAINTLLSPEQIKNIDDVFKNYESINRADNETVKANYVKNRNAYNVELDRYLVHDYSGFFTSGSSRNTTSYAYNRQNNYASSQQRNQSGNSNSSSSAGKIAVIIVIIIVVAFFGSCAACIHEIREDMAASEVKRREIINEHAKYITEQDYNRTHPYSFVIENPSVPYVGMPESMIDSTGLGKHNYYSESIVNGRISSEIHYYTWKRSQHDVVYSAVVEFGVVKEVDDYR